MDEFAKSLTGKTLYRVLFLVNAVAAVALVFVGLNAWAFDVSKEGWWAFGGIGGVMVAAVLRARGSDANALFVIVAVTLLNLYFARGIG